MTELEKNYFNPYREFTAAPVEYEGSVSGKISLPKDVSSISPSGITVFSSNVPEKTENKTEYNYWTENANSHYEPTINITNTNINQNINEIQKKAVNFFQKKFYDYNKSQGLKEDVAKNLSIIQSAGTVGNLMQESSLNTKAVGDSGKAIGLAQWHPDRQIGLKELAKKRGTDIYNLDTQLEYVWQELNSTHKRALKELYNSQNIQQATTAFMKHFEKPGDLKLQNRIDFAFSLVNHG